MADPDPRTAHLIDLRPPAEREAAPLTGARVTALTLDQIEDGQHGLTPAREALLVVCARGTQADLAARYLRSDGLDARAWRGTVAELQAQLRDG
ncbi:rhodanese-like domain-containing protein [Deinococcus wulumuqiensis]